MLPIFDDPGVCCRLEMVRLTGAAGNGCAANVTGGVVTANGTMPVCKSEGTRTAKSIPFPARRICVTGVLKVRRTSVPAGRGEEEPENAQGSPAAQANVCDALNSKVTL